MIGKMTLPPHVRQHTIPNLNYLFARADRGGAGWIGRLDAPKGETFGGIIFYSEKGSRVVHVAPLAEYGGLRPICRWTCERQGERGEEIFLYMPPATAYCMWRNWDGVGASAWAWIIPRVTSRQDEFEHWWIVRCRCLWRRLREGMEVERYSHYRRTVEDDKRDMLLRWRMGDNRPAPRHPAWRLDWMVAAGMTPWDMVRRSTTYPMEKDNPTARAFLRMVAKYKRK